MPTKEEQAAINRLLEKKQARAEARKQTDEPTSFPSKVIMFSQAEKQNVVMPVKPAFPTSTGVGVLTSDKVSIVSKPIPQNWTPPARPKFPTASGRDDIQVASGVVIIPRRKL